MAAARGRDSTLTLAIRSVAGVCRSNQAENVTSVEKSPVTPRGRPIPNPIARRGTNWATEVRVPEILTAPLPEILAALS